MPHMRPEKLRQVDLNLLIIFALIAEEKSVTKASALLLLSQRLTAKGRRQLVVETSKWDKLAGAIARILRPTEQGVEQEGKP